MTLFNAIGTDDIFRNALEQFHQGKPDGATLDVLESWGGEPTPKAADLLKARVKQAGAENKLFLRRIPELPMGMETELKFRLPARSLTTLAKGRVPGVEEDARSALGLSLPMAG